MLDPSMPWIASGYKKFLPQDFCSRHSKTPNSWEDDFHDVLHSPSPVSHQKRRVKSATSGRHRSHPKPPELNRPPQYRPKSASHVIRNSGDVNIPIYSSGTEDPRIQTAYRLPRRPKSAIHIRHRPSLAQNKSVTEVERIHNARLMVSTIPVGRTTTNKPCAFCPVECRPKSSSSQRPISSTGLLAADVPSHFDRSNFWAKGTSRPRTAPTSRREFLHLPRHNYIRRGNVPHYTHFIKGLNLFPRDGSPLPHPTPPKPAVIVVGDEEEFSISSRHGGSTFKDDDTLGCGRSEIDDSDWEDMDSDGGDGVLDEEEADKGHGIDKTGPGTDTDIAIPEIDLNDIHPDTESKEQQDESSHLADAVQNQPESVENQEELTSVETQDEVTPAGINIPTITQNIPEEDVDEELANLSAGNDGNGGIEGEEEETFPPAPSPSPITVETESDMPVTTEILGNEKGDSETEKEVDPGNSEKEKLSEPPMDDLGKLHAGKDENDNSLKMEKEVKEKNVEKASSDKKVKLEKEVGGLTPTVKMIPTPPVPVKEGHDSSSGSSKKVDRKQSQPTKRSKVKKEVRIKEPDAEKAVKPGEEDGDKRKGDEVNLEEKKTEVNDTMGKGVLNMGGELQLTSQIMLSGGRSPGTLEDLQPTPQIVLSEEKSPGTLEELSSQQEEKADKRGTGSENKASSDIAKKEEPTQVAPKLGPPPPRMKVDIMGMDSEEILDLEMKLRRKGPGSYISDTEESLSDLLETPSTQNVKTAKKFVAAPWNCCRVALSRRAGRFEMPMDIRELVGMTPVEYLLKYCKVNAQRKALYKRTFSRVDKDCDGKINRKELDRAVTEVLVDTVNEEQLASVLKMIGIDDNNLMMRFPLFAPLCALLERQYYSYFVTEDSSDREARLKDRLEDADFTALDWKLDGYELDENLRNLLYML